jgi:hypothetical protein
MNMRCFNPQFFIGSRVGDVAIENERAQAARIYDRRLDVLIEAVKVLAATVPSESLTPADQLALEQLRALRPAPSGDEPYPVPRRGGRMAIWR